MSNILWFKRIKYFWVGYKTLAHWLSLKPIVTKLEWRKEKSTIIFCVLHASSCHVLPESARGLIDSQDAPPTSYNPAGNVSQLFLLFYRKCVWRLCPFWTAPRFSHFVFPKSSLFQSHRNLELLPKLYWPLEKKTEVLRMTIWRCKKRKLRGCNWRRWWCLRLHNWRVQKRCSRNRVDFECFELEEVIEFMIRIRAVNWYRH